MSDRASVTLRPKLPGLDGLRAFAVVLVVLGHYAPRPVADQQGLQDWVAALGVDIFFVVSGFLITHLLLREEESLGSFNLPLFYARRAVRILPALFVYLSVLVVLRLVGLTSTPFADVFAGLLFVRNLVGTSNETGHLWSLAIEEQFYLVWPLVLMIGGKSMRLASVTALVIAAPIWRRLATTGPDFINPSRTDLRLLPILCGCLLALALHAPRLRLWMPRLHANQRWLVAACLPIVIVSAFAPAITIPGMRGVLHSVGTVAIAGLVVAATNSRPGILSTILNAPPVAWLGTLSYSLYLWQQPFAPALFGSSSLWFRAYPVNILLAFACALASFYLVERPLMRLRNRLTPRVTPAAGTVRHLESGHVPCP